MELEYTLKLVNGIYQQVPLEPVTESVIENTSQELSSVLQSEIKTVAPKKIPERPIKPTAKGKAK